MGIASDISSDWDASLAALAWQFDAGVDETLCETPIDRYGLPDPQPVVRAAPVQAPPQAQRGAAKPAPPPEVKVEAIDPVALARAAAGSASSVEDLREAVLNFEHCEMKKGARNTVFGDGNPKARVMVIGDMPGRDEDLAGQPFAGDEGQILDRLLGFIGLSRQSPDTEAAVYLSNLIFWRPLGDRLPPPEDVAMMRPFLERHIALVDPAMIVVTGNLALEALTGERRLLRARGAWQTALGRPLLPLLPPSMLRSAADRRATWGDLLSLKARLRAAKE
ncbi:uracil-DNA glycosylase [Xinfangfangia sp. CPCC 101601]|uniref:Uracil-DNA glycosylase n=1 Tax=Pseudogemmobacter lacusdianii TaxID=3069608 RepID=A0ABU0W070_9RHOB|nr:uracil-DNA glycosylase [Xinfangfangia sp. CPCC 101601]MDQ2067415.1 uracil-DNA glycosylase [Xinfangfangia sp. CPCC 101601]